MGRCGICGKQTGSLTKTCEKRYSPRADGGIEVCTDCFNLLIVNDYESLDGKMGDKIRVKEVGA